MDDKKNKLTDFLLADFNSIKSEIARRSNLQKAVIASMLAFYAWLLQLSFSNEMTVSLIILIWVISFLGYTFYIREAAEINRLGWIIKEKIAKPAGELLECPPEMVIPSEAHAQKPTQTEWKSVVNTIFKAFIYLIFPLYFTGIYICKHYGT